MGSRVTWPVFGNSCEAIPHPVGVRAVNGLHGRLQWAEEQAHELLTTDACSVSEHSRCKGEVLAVLER